MTLTLFIYVYASLMKNPPPQHVAIIMDGNGRWAKSKNMLLSSGHKKGADVAFNIAKEAHALGIKWLTLYTFSTENWKRPTSWISDLMGLLKWYLDNEIARLKENNTRLYVIGDVSKFSDDIKKGLEDAMNTTQSCTGLNLVLALNYGSHDEITRGVKSIAKQVLDGSLKIEDISTQTISDSLYTKDMPDPDLLIRTSGEQRISNYLLWQLAYSELKFVSKAWPDYTPQDFRENILDYQNRNRRFGGYVDE